MRTSLCGMAIILTMFIFPASGQELDDPESSKEKSLEHASRSAGVGQKTQLGILLSRAKESHDLSAEEAGRLALAARGDTIHYFARLKERQTVEMTVQQRGTGMSLIQRTGQWRSTTTPSDDPRDRDPFGEGSLFAKTLAKILADRKAAQVKGDKD